MNYADFKTFLRTFLWKQNDTDLANAMDSLIRMADGELNRVLDIQRRQKTALLTPTTQDYSLPSDFRHMVALNNIAQTSNGSFASTTLMDIYTKRQQGYSASVQPLFAVDQGVGSQKILRLVGPFSVAVPGALTLVYRANVPDFSTLGSSWLEADFLDLYTYTVLSHAAPFLLQDERLPVWQSMKSDAIASAIAEDRHSITHGGSPMQMQPHRRVP